MAYLVKYTVTFVYPQIDVKGEMKVEHGEIWLEDLFKEPKIVSDEGSARDYVWKLYEDERHPDHRKGIDWVEIPQKVLDSFDDDSELGYVQKRKYELVIDSVEKV